MNYKAFCKNGKPFLFLDNEGIGNRSDGKSSGI